LGAGLPSGHVIAGIGTAGLFDGVEVVTTGTIVGVGAIILPNGDDVGKSVSSVGLASGIGICVGIGSILSIGGKVGKSVSSVGLATGVGICVGIGSILSIGGKVGIEVSSVGLATGVGNCV
jgi:hypothetical protein